MPPLHMQDELATGIAADEAALGGRGRERTKEARLYAGG